MTSSISQHYHYNNNNKSKQVTPIPIKTTSKIDNNHHHSIVDNDRIIRMIKPPISPPIKTKTMLLNNNNNLTNNSVRIERNYSYIEAIRDQNSTDDTDDNETIDDESSPKSPSQKEIHGNNNNNNNKKKDSSTSTLSSTSPVISSNNSQVSNNNIIVNPNNNSNCCSPPLTKSQSQSSIYSLFKNTFSPFSIRRWRSKSRDKLLNSTSITGGSHQSQSQVQNQNSKKSTTTTTENCCRSSKKKSKIATVIDNRKLQQNNNNSTVNNNGLFIKNNNNNHHQIFNTCVKPPPTPTPNSVIMNHQRKNDNDKNNPQFPINHSNTTSLIDQIDYAISKISNNSASTPLNKDNNNYSINGAHSIKSFTSTSLKVTQNQSQIQIVTRNESIDNNNITKSNQQQVLINQSKSPQTEKQKANLKLFCYLNGYDMKKGSSSLAASPSETSSSPSSSLSSSSSSSSPLSTTNGKEINKKITPNTYLDQLQSVESLNLSQRYYDLKFNSKHDISQQQLQKPLSNPLKTDEIIKIISPTTQNTSTNESDTTTIKKVTKSCFLFFFIKFSFLF
jgi:hypothetical protein